jgi:hypothetical protein
VPGPVSVNGAATRILKLKADDPKGVGFFMLAAQTTCAGRAIGISQAKDFGFRNTAPMLQCLTIIVSHCLTIGAGFTSLPLLQ